MSPPPAKVRLAESSRRTVSERPRSVERAHDSGADQARQVEEEAHRRLKSHSHTVLRHIACESRDGVLTLRGRVSSFYLKQVAQTVVRGIAGVQQVVNALEVD